MDAFVDILAFAGSAREGSLNKKVIAQAAVIAKELGIKLMVIDLKDYPMPFCDTDEEMQRGMPEAAKRLRKLMIQSPAILIASPEYNGSVTALLKNTIDWATRAEEGKPSREAFKDKRFGLMSTSPGLGAGIQGLVHLKMVIERIGGIVVPQQVTIPNAFTSFDEQGQLLDPSKKEDIKQLLLQLTYSSN